MPVVGDGLNQDLDGSGAVLVQRNVKEAWKDGIDQALKLVHGADLDDALAQVVAKLIAGGF